MTLTIIWEHCVIAREYVKDLEDTNDYDYRLLYLIDVVLYPVYKLTYSSLMPVLLAELHVVL